ncbi:hypothetical protein VSDG_03737 [Cytospora chrysosperma]|uniref:Uncharacterized protein n=1 Tax=Cytospora chrysosperma TaxID=252740 RepID=A0A423W6I1_CYTCH|nr:hypothetical protein VSDG_03737 [Valsa sordida]
MLLAAIMCIGLVQASPTDGFTEVLHTPHKTYEVIDMDWTVQINNTAIPYDLNITGTIEDVFNGLAQADPAAAAAISKAIDNQLHGPIWWCNDNKVSKTLDGFDQIAYGAKILFDLCDPNWKHASFSGQQFYDDGWNVIVRGGNC